MNNHTKTLFFLLAKLILSSFHTALALSTNTRPPSSFSEQKHHNVVVIGGGASGMFASIAAADEILKLGKKIRNEDCHVIVMEGGKKLMSKVAISGGGRCNVLHDTSKPLNQILSSYPRGNKELNGLFSKRFSPSDARHWFEQRCGVSLKTEADGRMFPVTDSSQTIMDAIMNQARAVGVKIELENRVMGVRKGDDKEGFIVQCKNGDEVQADAVILATGSSPRGYEFAEKLGHKIVQPVPSLFTFNTANMVKKGSSSAVFYDLAGVSVQDTILTLKVKVPGRKKAKAITQQGPVLVTHHGLSGPAALRLSAYAAREFHSMNYSCHITCHWAPQAGQTMEQIMDWLWKQRTIMPKRTVMSSCPFIEKQRQDDTDKKVQPLIPKRLWKALVLYSNFDDESLIWADVSKKKVRELARNIAEMDVEVTGKGVFKDEFVTAGGVSLKQIDMKNMESKITPGLFFCGEVIDVDGITGGYNFMNCWGTGYVAGHGAAQFALNQILDSTLKQN